MAADRPGSVVRITVMTRARLGVRVKFYFAAALRNFSHSTLWRCGLVIALVLGLRSRSGLVLGSGLILFCRSTALFAVLSTLHLYSVYSTFPSADDDYSSVLVQLHQVSRVRIGLDT